MLTKQKVFLIYYCNDYHTATNAIITNYIVQIIKIFAYQLKENPMQVIWKL